MPFVVCEQAARAFFFDFPGAFGYFSQSISTVLERAFIMKLKKTMLAFVAAIMLPLTFFPHESFAADTTLSVKKGDTACTETATTCFTSIQSAINYAGTLRSSSTGTTATFSIQVEAGTYPEAVTLSTGITSLVGRETARTILTGGGSGNVITVSSGSPVISNLSLLNAQVGVAITNNATATIKNNMFNLGLSGTAVQITQSTAQTSISNNTFYSNNVAISSSVDLPIKNNIFFSNTTAITPLAIFARTNVTYNDFYPSNAADPLNGLTSDMYNNISSDPLFIGEATGDFHLKTGSPCINSGLESSAVDMGAYGGPKADMIPFKVSGVTGSLDTTTNAISVSWNKNLDYKVTGYRIWYGKTHGGPYDGTGATDGASPITVPTGTTASTYILSGLTATVNTPASPVLNQASPLNEGLNLNWSPVDGATSYKIYWSDSSFNMSSLPTNSLVVDAPSTSCLLPGLTNGKTYYVAVSAIAEASYYVAVTAIYADPDRTPGILNESAYSAEKTFGTGDIKESDISVVLNEYPEALVAYPNLTSHGQRCFIATAAFGYYSAPEVRALREFRDRYLLTNSAGSAFVRWYYEHGPIAAAYIDAHPAYKPVVRAALMPAVGAALFMTKTPFFIRTVVALFLLMLALMVAYRLFSKKLSGSGGAR